jgi:hypothetical protein
VKKQIAPVEKSYQPVERVQQSHKPEQGTVERELQRVNEQVDRSYDIRPEPSTVYERSATPAQDSLESESCAAPAEQRDIEAAVAAGAAGYTGVSIGMFFSILVAIIMLRSLMLNHRGCPSKSMAKKDQIRTSLAMTQEWGESCL